MASTNQGRSLKKFCSLLTYIEHRNRELYDAIHDLCLTGIFNTRRGRSVTFLMPDPKSSFHSKIVNAAYGADPDTAANLIRACTLTVHIKSLDDFAKVDGGKLPNELKQQLEVETPGKKEVILKNGDATIIADGSFIPLYETSRFGVFVIKSGEISTDNSGAPDRRPTPRSTSKKMQTFDDAFEISGGMERAMQTHVKSNSINKHALVKAMLNSWKTQIHSKGTAPNWLINDNENIFIKAAVSFCSYIEAKEQNEAHRIFNLLDENPMCICAILCIFVDDALYDRWVNDNPTTPPTFSYAKYSTFLNNRNGTSFDMAACLKDSIEHIRAGNMDSYADMFINTYSTLYGDNATKMLAYHESLFVLFGLLRAVESGNTSKVDSFIEIYNLHYCVGKQAMLTSKASLANDILNSALACKSFEFMQTTYFVPRNDSNIKTLDINNWNETSVKLDVTRLNPVPVVKSYFANM